jgi:hypothetical protein
VDDPGEAYGRVLQTMREMAQTALDLGADEQETSATSAKRAAVGLRVNALDCGLGLTRRWEK